MKAARALLAEFRSGKGLKGQLLRGGVGSVAIKIGASLLNVTLAIVLARTLGAEGFGVYSFVFALITILAIPAQMGLPNLVVRETAKAQAANDWPLINGLWRWSTLMALMMSAALIAIGALAAWIFAARLPEGGLAVFYWGLVLVPLIALGNLRGAALRGLRHVVQGQLPEFILRPAFLIVLVLGAHFGLSARALTASDAMMLHALASLAAFMIGAWLLLRGRPQELVTQKQVASDGLTWLASAVPLGLTGGLLVINQNVGIIFLGLIYDEREVGLLRIAIQGGMLAGLGLSMANLVVLPYISKFYNEKNFLDLQRVANVSAFMSVTISLVVLVVFAVGGRQILGLLFGAAYTDAFWPLIILCTGHLVASCFASAGALLAMTHLEKQFLYANVLSLAMMIVLLGILGPRLGGTGVAFSMAACLVFSQVYQSIVARKELGIDSTIGRFMGRIC